MQALVVNASPNGRRGSTAAILTPFVDGIRAAGGSVETEYLSRLSIKPCMGDRNCWFKRKNVCVQQDDMAMLVDKFRSADLVVFSTPVYCDGVPGPLKIAMDRLVVLGNPFLKLTDNHTRHPAPYGEKRRSFVLVASCGLWEKDNFDPMLAHLRAFCRNISTEFIGALLRPHAFAMKNSPINDILRAAKSAGRELVEHGTISPALQETVSRKIVTRDAYMEWVNRTVDGYYSEQDKELLFGAACSPDR